MKKQQKIRICQSNRISHFSQHEKKNDENEEKRTCKHKAASRVFRMQVRYNRNEFAYNYTTGNQIRH